MDPTLPPPSPGPAPTRDREALRVLIGGMLGLMVAMGIGRFAFTPILPLMQRDLGLSHAQAGWLAGLNYLGYLIGAVGCSLAPQLLRRRLVSGGALVASLVTTALMGATLSLGWWGVQRLIGGVASAILFIVISAEVADALARRGHGHWTGALYGGVGAGIAVSGLAVPLLDARGGWDVAWFGMGLLALLLAAAGIALGRRRTLVGEVTADTAPPQGRLRAIGQLSAAYFCEGLGYIVTATFLVAIIARTEGLAGLAPWSWVAVGLAALPSTLFWPWLARRTSPRTALLWAYGVQAAGILVSAHATTAGEALFAAVTFGGTFLAIVGLALAEATRRSPHDRRRAAAILTAAFGVGQILGPPLAGWLADLHGGFELPLLAAALVVTAGMVLLWLDRGFAEPQTDGERR